jgi:DeoR/GlpR family transcriptional regulator of sugar metabolism
MKSQRHETIVNEVVLNGAASITALADRLGVSEVTIRRDLDELDRAGRIQRVRSGAQRLVPRRPEPPAYQRALAQAREKHAIAQAAAESVHEGDVIGLHLGTTVLELARILALRPWRHLQVITNGFAILDALVQVPGVQILFVGGIVDPGEMGAFGLLTEEIMRRTYIDKLFIGCRGLDARAGTSHDMNVENAVASERAFVGSAQQVFLLADHSKFGRVYPLQSIPITEIDLVITDPLAPEATLEELRRQDIRVVVAGAGPAAIPIGAQDSDDADACAVSDRE